MKKLILMRGLPGSGKSTAARTLARDAFEREVANSVVIYSTDDFWIVDGEYQFDRDRAGQAHAWNLDRCKSAMKTEVQLIIIDNTNVLREYMQPYKSWAERFSYEVIEHSMHTTVKFDGPITAADIDRCVVNNIHEVPEDIIRNMADQWEE